MAGWRIRWAAKRLFSVENFKNQKRHLVNPSAYYAALMLKLIPGLHRSPLQLHLKSGTRLFIRDFMSLYIYHEIFLDEVYDAELKNRAPLVIDIGANTGFFALYAKQRWPDAKILCFEPLPDNGDQLEKNIEANALDGVALYRQGVAGTCSQAALHVHAKNIGGHSIYAERAGSISIPISVIDIGTVLDLAGEATCDLLKIDCEGCEYDIINRLTQAQADRIGQILYEPTPALYDSKMLNGRLRQLGYSVSYRKGLYHATRRQSLIFAPAPKPTPETRARCVASQTSPVEPIS
ncbi:MAG: FkbM family methyltransferase [Betaproteobacteria bacterium]